MWDDLNAWSGLMLHMRDKVGTLATMRKAWNMDCPIRVDWDRMTKLMDPWQASATNVGLKLCHSFEARTIRSFRSWKRNAEAPILEVCMGCLVENAADDEKDQQGAKRKYAYIIDSCSELESGREAAVEPIVEREPSQKRGRTTKTSGLG